MKLIFLGTGTSHGVPVIGCTCKTCRSSDQKDRRNRCCAFVTNRDEAAGAGGKPFVPTDVLIDAGQEFRLQAIKNNVTRLDAVLLTHAHADHIFGLDDLRIFSFTKPEKSGDKASGNLSKEEKKPLPIYANNWTLRYIKGAFAYAFGEVKQGGGVPNLSLNENAVFTKENPLKVNELEIIPVNIKHGSNDDSGYVFTKESRTVLYLTDCSYIPEESFELIRGISDKPEHLVIDALRKREHTTHFNFDQALEAADRIGAKHTWFTHMCHDFTHEGIKSYIAEHLENYPNLNRIVKEGGSVAPAYDGLEISF